LHTHLLVWNTRQYIIKLWQILRSLKRLLVLLGIRPMLINLKGTRGIRLSHLLVLLLINQQRLEVDFYGDPWLLVLLLRNVLYFFDILVLGIASLGLQLLLLVIMRLQISLIIVRNDISILEPCFLLRMPVLV